MEIKMRQSIKFTSDEISELANKAVALRDWLTEAVPAVASRPEIPVAVMTVGIVVSLSGQSLLMDSWIPDTVCWNWGCIQPR